MRRTVLLAVAITSMGLPGAALHAQGVPVSVADNADPYAASIAEAVRRFDIPAGWIRAVMGAESAGDTGAISAKGARGLMQIMPATWDDLRARYGLGSDPFDVHDNILAGAARSDERPVGTECRSRWSPGHVTKKTF